MKVYQCGNSTCRTACHPLPLPDGWKCMACGLTTPPTMWLTREVPDPEPVPEPDPAPVVVVVTPPPPPVVQPLPPPATDGWQLTEDPFVDLDEEEEAPVHITTAVTEVAVPDSLPMEQGVLELATGKRSRPVKGMLADALADAKAKRKKDAAVKKWLAYNAQWKKTGKRPMGKPPLRPDGC